MGLDGEEKKKTVVPAGMQFLANEMLADGESFISQQIDRQSIVSPVDKRSTAIDINALYVVLRMLGFHCSAADQGEMRTWLLEQECFASGPDFVEQHIIFIDRAKLLAALKKYKGVAATGRYKERDEVSRMIEAEYEGFS